MYREKEKKKFNLISYFFKRILHNYHHYNHQQLQIEMQLSWKDIPPVPTSNDMLDIVLNRTQRKTPTVIRPGFKITRIRAFI